MANEMPSSDDHLGLSRKVLAYTEAFSRLVDRAKTMTLTDDDWLPIQELVNVEKFQRIGVFLTPKAEIIGWNQYKSYINQYAEGISWEGTLRHITEATRRVVLELEERNTRGNVTDRSNTVTIYEFDDANRLQQLHVYVMPLS
jgi:hypothetical protein